MEAKDYLAYIVNEIHTTIVATVDDEGLPVTAAIDMMDSDENGLYFLTAKGKGFYDRLKKRIGCGSCLPVCPQKCISTGSIPFCIEQAHCLHCGNCMKACPVGAVQKR